MEGDGFRESFLQRCKPYIAMISVQIGHAGLLTITKLSLNNGMSHYVLVVYRHAIATATIAPFALVLERKVRPRITFPIFMQMFVLGLLGPVTDQNLFYAGLKFTSPTFASAICNMLPAMTFVMAVIFKMEILDIRKVRCQAKVIGTVVSLTGAMLMTLYKGQVIHFFWSRDIHHPRNYVLENINYFGEKDWIKGSIMMIIATLVWASFFILQSVTSRRYPTHLSLTTIVCFLGTLQSIVVTFIMEEHKASIWSIGWDMNLLAVAYAGIISSGITYYIQGIVMQKSGPVFATAFSPLMLISAAIMGSFIVADKIYLGGPCSYQQTYMFSAGDNKQVKCWDLQQNKVKYTFHYVFGAILIVTGLYFVLWGKYEEHKEKEAEAVTEAINGCSNENGTMETVIKNAESNEIEMQNDEACKESGVDINTPKA